MTKSRLLVLMLILSALLIAGVACSSNEPPSQLAGAKEESQPAAMDQKSQDETAATQQGQPGTEPAQMAQEKSSVATPERVELTGMVEQSGDGIVIVTDLGKYNVTGQDLSGLVGKTVNVTGALEESAGQYTINVLSVEESE